jgi:hypothetical protein
MAVILSEPTPEIGIVEVYRATGAGPRQEHEYTE